MDARMMKKAVASRLDGRGDELAPGDRR